jgi:SAM-dependent methyltransferase
MRFVVDYVTRNKGIKDIFIYERVTATYAQLKKYLPSLQGSEYLGNQYNSGDVINGIVHQDAMNLSFKEASFDYMVSNDVFEHVSNYKKAFEEAYRCLKNNGHLVMSIPIFKDREKTVIRTTINNDGSLNYLMPPVYHGNPISEDGSLVFTEFGWDVIDDLLDCGFKDAYAVVYYSEEKGYFGDSPLIFEAIK